MQYTWERPVVGILLSECRPWRTAFHVAVGPALLHCEAKLPLSISFPSLRGQSPSSSLPTAGTEHLLHSKAKPLPLPPNSLQGQVPRSPRQEEVPGGLGAGVRGIGVWGGLGAGVKGIGV